MNTSKSYIKIFGRVRAGLMIALAAGLAACSNDIETPEWTPGETSQGAGVTFESSNSDFIILIEGEQTVANFTLKRLNTNGELTVPVKVIEAPETMIFPQTVTFADGEKNATLAVDCSAMPKATPVDIKISFPDEYLNPYADGIACYEGSIILSTWDEVGGSPVKLEILDWSYKATDLQPYESKMYKLSGSDRYKVDNFVGTDYSFTFDLIPSPFGTGRYRIIPVGNQVTLKEYGMGDYSYYNSWWFVSDDLEEWPEVILTNDKGKETTLYYIEFFWYDNDTSTDFCVATIPESGKCYATMAFTGYYDEDMSKYAPYYNLRFRWTETNTQLK